MNLVVPHIHQLANLKRHLFDPLIMLLLSAAYSSPQPFLRTLKS